MEKIKSLKNVMFSLLVVFVAVVFFLSRTARGNGMEMILFYSPSCHHCHADIEFLDNKVVPKYPDLKITKHNTTTRVGANYYIYYKKKLNFDTNGVPVAVFGDKYEVGFGTEDTTGKVYLENIDEMFKKLSEEKAK